MNARVLAIMLMAGAAACVGASMANAQMQFAALDSAAPPGLGEIEQFPITPRQAPGAPRLSLSPRPHKRRAGTRSGRFPCARFGDARAPDLFPSRRPPPAAGAAVSPEPAPQVPRPVVPERPSLALVGTIVGEGESIAIFYNPTTKTTIRLRLGETDDNGWKLARSMPARACWKRAVSL